MSFNDYLASKKIDGNAFFLAEPSLYKNWETEFNQMHPNSFTVQKLNLINPIRRKYLLHVEEKNPPASTALPDSTPLPSPPPNAAKPSRPMMKPKPKLS